MIYIINGKSHFATPPPFFKKIYTIFQFSIESFKKGGKEWHNIYIYIYSPPTQ